MMLDGGDVDDIRAFMAVVDAKGFAAAGRALGLSRSAAAKAVGRLESKYATRLLNRTTRSLALTDAGQALYEKGVEWGEEGSLSSALVQLGLGTSSPL